MYIYSGQPSKNREIEERADAAKGAIGSYGADGLMSQACIREYFDIIYKVSIDGARTDDINNAYRIDFASIASEFHLIDGIRLGVVIQDQDIKGILAMDKIPFDRIEAFYKKNLK